MFSWYIPKIENLQKLTFSFDIVDTTNSKLRVGCGK